MDDVITDVLILGCGIAGCTAALELAKSGVSISVVTAADDIIESATKLAQGGIIYRCESDPALLEEDVMKAGDGISNRRAVHILATEGPKAVEDILIKELNVPFDKKDGRLHLTKEAAHSCRRITHVHDYTGLAIEEAFMDAIRNYPNVHIYTGHTLIDILTKSHHFAQKTDDDSCVGAYILDRKNDTVKTFLAKKTIIATGGIGQIFMRTVNPPLSRGDGIYAAYRAGARLKNLEYVQFHPTSLYHPDVSDFLISEAVRGEGGKLKTKNGETFMEKYHEKGCLAPRDVVSRAIFQQLLESGDDYVLLDVASYLPSEKIKEYFSSIYQKCLKYGINITKQPIPVAPSAHYLCGGIEVDEHGRTNIGNLYAIGEASCTGVHGANRLASTSLLECLVWGRRAASDIKNMLADSGYPSPGNVLSWKYTHKIETVDPALIQQDWFTIKSIMWNYVGIIRTRKRLERAVADLEYLQKRIDEFYRDAKICDELIGLRSGVGTALFIARAALNNPISKGCHFMEKRENGI
ncbi:MAG: L-aspartate oxidase [Candidatus Micrarchaeota archaeon]|nr:L-aspartate oxidase [Candidatus Micrarchaeota archaeon]